MIAMPLNYAKKKQSTADGSIAYSFMVCCACCYI